MPIDAFKIFGGYILNYWWIFTPVVLFFIFWALWMNYIQTKFINSIKWTLLEIKIPREILKTPKAMEQVFAGFHGIYSSPNFVEKYFKGEVPEWFSLEIIGEGGSVRFLIRTPEKFRNLVESQIYAQYPDTEIAEVEDYVNKLPRDIPSKDYDLWGTELILTKEDAYPIRTYPAFEEKEEEARIDPLASLSEVLSSLKSGEHLWLQILIRPAPDEWKESGEKLVEKLIGKKVKRTEGGWMIEEAHGWLEAAGEVLTESISGSGKAERVKEKERTMENFMVSLTPGQREVVLEIEKNVSKIGFDTGIRFIYWAKSDVFSKPNAAAVLGTFKQFNTLNLNGFKRNSKVTPSVDYFFKKSRNLYRKKIIASRYKSRDMRRFQQKPFVFNTEELATIYHFPGKVVGAPTMPRIEAKRGAPPAGLPTE